MNDTRGSLDGTGRRFALVVSRFNETVTDQLLEGAVRTLTEHGVAEEALEVIRVPGAWELPGATARVLERGSVDGVVALGCVVRGETPHFDYIAGEASRGLGDLSVRAEVPVTFGVLTTDTLEQALVRAGGRRGDPSSHKGREAALTLLEMANLYRTLR
jgi:6,7-dimethyl-8-ribityllumazine synthase